MSDNKEKDTAAASTANPPPVEAIEEDDEFEEFEPCQWNKNEEDAEDSQQWQVSIVVLLRFKSVVYNDIIYDVFIY